MTLLPKARIADILEQEADAELMLYDLRIDKVYVLNETLKTVYKNCGRSVDELKRTHKYNDDLIHLALVELNACDLLENYQSDHFAGLSRRAVIRQVGLASAVVLPLIASLTAPAAPQAASGCVNPNGRPTNKEVTTQIITQFNNRDDNRAYANMILRGQCCSNNIRNFGTDGCGDTQGERCDAFGYCV